MSRKEKRIDLSESEESMLLQASKYHEKPRYREKCRAILLDHAGVNIKHIAQHLKISHFPIVIWLIAWEEFQFDSLARKKGQGRKLILTVTNSAHVETLDKAVEIHRQNVKGIQTGLMKELQTTMSADTAKQFLKKLLFMATHPTLYVSSPK